MDNFNRGITNKAFINALNEIRKDPNSFWSKTINNKKLFIAIRENEIDVYYNGNRMYKLSFPRGIFKAKTDHAFYAGDIPLIDHLSSLNDFDSFLVKMYNYSGEERKQVYCYLLKSENSLDVEITFSKNIVPDNQRTTIDFCRFEEDVKGNIILVFYEAKIFSNAALRSQNGDAPVLEQIKRSDNAISKNKDDIKKSYQNVCKNLIELNLRVPDSIIGKISTDGTDFSVNLGTQLIIFGTDEKNDSNWEKNTNQNSWKYLVIG